MALNGQVYGANATMKPDNRRQFNNTNAVLSDHLANTGYRQLAAQDDSVNAGSAVRKSSKMDSIKAFVDANRSMQDQNYGRR